MAEKNERVANQLYARQRIAMQGSKHRRERGQALILVLVFMFVGSLVIAPLLSFMMTGLKAGQMYENSMLDDYAADAGIEHAVHQIGSGSGNLPDDIGESLDYSLDKKVNDRDVEISVECIWILDGIEEIPKSAKPNSKWAVSARSEPGRIRIEVAFPEGGKGNLEKLGVLIPSKFDYVTGSSSLYEDNIAHNEPEILEAGLRRLIIWNWEGGKEVDFENWEVRTQVFDVTPNEVPLWSISWARYPLFTQGEPAGAHALSWDSRYELYMVTSTAGDTEIESYVLKGLYEGFGKYDVSILTYSR
jgi:hypothetical protein